MKTERNQIGKKNEEFRSAIRQTYFTVNDVPYVKYLHATKGWRTRRDIAIAKPNKDDFLNFLRSIKAAPSVTEAIENAT